MDSNILRRVGFDKYNMPKEIEAWLSGFGLHLRGDDETKAAALLRSLGYTVISPKGMQEADRKQRGKR
jgi:hypothetical protein